MELNKIVAAVLLAGIIAMVSGIIAEMLVSPQPLQRNAYAVSTGAAPATEAAPAATGVDVPPIAPLLANADPAAGQTVARACVACHTFEKGGANKVGPNQWNLVDNPMGHAQGFNYSAAIQARHAAGDTWTYENLNKFLTAPRQFIPGTTMAFAGIRSERDRANLIAWLRTNSDSPPPLPSPAEAAASPAAGGAAAAGSEPAGSVSGGGGAGGAAGASGAGTGSAPATPAPAGSPPAGAPASEAAPAAVAPAETPAATPAESAPAATPGSGG